MVGHGMACASLFLWASTPAAQRRACMCACLTCRFALPLKHSLVIWQATRSERCLRRPSLLHKLYHKRSSPRSSRDRAWILKLSCASAGRCWAGRHRDICWGDLNARRHLDAPRHSPDSECCIAWHCEVPASRNRRPGACRSLRTLLLLCFFKGRTGIPGRLTQACTSHRDLDNAHALCRSAACSPPPAALFFDLPGPALVQTNSSA